MRARVDGQCQSVRQLPRLLLLLGMRLSAATGGTICSNEPRVCDGTYADVRDDLYPRLSLYLQGQDLSGTIPTELGLLTAMTNGLGLRDNRLSGTIPTELGRLTNLRNSVYLDHNLLSGTLPSQLGMLTKLRYYLTVHTNQLSGTVPDELGSERGLNAPECWLTWSTDCTPIHVFRAWQPAWARHGYYNDEL